MKISILVDNNGIVLPFFSSGRLETYTDESGGWRRINSIAHDMGGELTMGVIRHKAEQFIAQLDNCNQVILKNVIGFAKPVLEEYNINIWVYKGELNATLLNHIRTEVQDKQAKQAFIVPEPKRQGNPQEQNYVLDLCSLLKPDAEAEIREVLVSFMQNTHFNELVILSYEKLIWIKAYAGLFHLKMVVKALPGNSWKISLIPEDIEGGLAFRKLIKLSQMPGHEDCSSCGSSESCITEQIKSQITREIP